METLNRHIGLFDFFSIFGAGVVVITSYITLLKPEYLAVLAEIEFSNIIYCVALSYTTGMVLYCVSSLVFDFPAFRLSASVIVKNYLNPKTKTLKYDKRYFDECSREALSHFRAQYDVLKLHGTPPKVDKLHSIFGMARGISFGYFALSAIALQMKQPLQIVLLFLLLAVLFYIMARKYLYRWVAWTCEEYSYLMKTASLKERESLKIVYDQIKNRKDEGNSTNNGGEQDEKSNVCC